MGKFVFIILIIQIFYVQTIFTAYKIIEYKVDVGVPLHISVINSVSLFYSNTNMIHVKQHINNNFTSECTKSYVCRFYNDDCSNNNTYEYFILVFHNENVKKSVSVYFVPDFNICQKGMTIFYVVITFVLIMFVFYYTIETCLYISFKLFY